MSFILQNNTAAPVSIDDIGLTVPASGILDLTLESPEHIAESGASGGDLNTLLNDAGPTLSINDPLDGVSALSGADGTEVVQVANDPHYRIRGGDLDQLTDVDLTGAADNYVLQRDGSGTWKPETVGTILGDANLGDLNDVTDSIGVGSKTATNPYLFKGTGGGDLTVIDATTDADFGEVIEDIVGAAFVNGTDTTFVYTDGSGTMQVNVDDVFLRNTGDSLTSGTLTISAGATINVVSGATLTLQQDSTATLVTPTGGFSSSNQLVNKEYVDSIAAGLDPKESVRVGTTPTDGPSGSGTFGGLIAAQDESNYDGSGSNGTFAAGTNYAQGDTITLDDGTLVTVDAPVAPGAVTQFTVTTAGTTNISGTTLNQTLTTGSGTGFTLTTGSANVSGLYDAAGGTAGTGEFTGVDLSSGTGDTIDGLNYTGTTSTGMIVGDRVLFKNQADAIQNGIYEITAAPSAANVTLTRSDDQDGSPTSEVSGGNFTYVEDTTPIFGGSVNSNTGWVVAWDGEVDLNVDPINWVQVNGTGSVVAGLGISQNGNTIDLNLGTAELSGATVVVTDYVAFHDTNGTPNSSGSQTRNSTVSNFLNDLDIVYNIGGNGILVQTSTNTFTNRTIIGSTTHGGGAGFTGLEGISIGRGDGVAGNPEIGIDLPSLTASPNTMDAADVFLMHDGTNNVKMTGQQIADGVSGIVSNLSYGQITGDTGTVTAVGPNELITFRGTAGTGNGIGITATNSGSADADIIDFALDISDLTAAAGPLVFADEIGVNDGGTTLKYTFNQVVDDLDIPHAITANGIVVRDGADSYTNRSIAVQGVGTQDGLEVANANGAAGNPTIGLDINAGLPAAGEDLAAGDLFAVYNLDATANEKMTGQEVADGVINIVFGSTNLNIVNINGQPTLVFDDSTRSDKTLSVAETAVSWSESSLSNNDWLNIGSAVDATSGYEIPMDATIVRFTAQLADNNGNTKSLDLYINGSINSTLTTFTGASGEKTARNEALNIDVNQDDKVQLRAGPTGGNIDDIVATVWLKWRA